MLISIIIPIYNKEETVLKSINSVLSQTYKNFELILIDDGSTDLSSQIVEQFRSNKKIKIFRQKNQGVAKARNTGIDLAVGEYILFLDADDYLEKDALSILSKHDRYDVVCGNFKYLSNEDFIFNRKFIIGTVDFHNYYATNTKYSLFNSNGRPLSSVCNKLYKTKFLKENMLFFEENILSEDRLFNLYLYLYSPKIKLLNDYTYCVVRQRKTRSTSKIKSFYNQITDLNIKFENKMHLMRKSSLHDDLLMLTFLNDSENLFRYIYRFENISKKTFKEYHKKIINAETEKKIKKWKKNNYIKSIDRNSRTVFYIIYLFVISRPLLTYYLIALSEKNK